MGRFESLWLTSWNCVLSFYCCYFVLLFLGISCGVGILHVLRTAGRWSSVSRYVVRPRAHIDGMRDVEMR
jgi:hypothetical protein